MLTATLIDSGSLPVAQVVVDVTPQDVAWTLEGSIGDYTWQVPGGAGIGDGQQLSLVDNRAPGNRTIVYRFTAGATVQTTTLVGGVPFPGDCIIQTLNGSTAVGVTPLWEFLHGEYESRQASFTVPNRRRPVVRYDVTSDLSGVLPFMAEMSQTPQIEAMLASGQPLMWRLGRHVFDLPQTAAFTYSSLSSRAYPLDRKRSWSMRFAVIDDPYLDERLGAFSWNEGYDAEWLSALWSEHDTRMTGMTWDQFDTFDWSTL